MPVMTGLGRSAVLPPSDLKLASCLKAYSACCPAMTGFAGNRAVAVGAVTRGADLLHDLLGLGGVAFDGNLRRARRRRTQALASAAATRRTSMLAPRDFGRIAEKRHCIVRRLSACHVAAFRRHNNDLCRYFDNARFIASAHEPHELPPDFGARGRFRRPLERGQIERDQRAHRAAESSRSSARRPAARRPSTSSTAATTADSSTCPATATRRCRRRERAHWGMLISGVSAGARFAERAWCIIVDSRHPLTPLDQQLLGWYAPSGQPVLVLLTKADKLGQQEAGAALSARESGARAALPARLSRCFSPRYGRHRCRSRAGHPARLAEIKSPRLKGSKTGGKEP